MGHFNLIELIGFYSLKVMKFKLLNGKMYYKNGKLYIQNSVNIIQEKLSKEFSQALTNEIKSKIEVKKVEIFFSGGIAENSFSSAIICGGVSSAIQSIYSYLSQTYYNVKLYEDVDTKFGEDNMELTFDFVVTISLILILISIIKAINNKREYVNENGYYKK